MGLNFATICPVTFVMAIILAMVWSYNSTENGCRMKVFQSLMFSWIFDFFLSLTPLVWLIAVTHQVTPSTLAVTTIMLVVSFVNSWKHPFGLVILAIAGVWNSLGFYSGASNSLETIVLTHVHTWPAICDEMWKQSIAANSLVLIYYLFLSRVWLAFVQFGNGTKEYHWIVKINKAYEEAQT